MPSFLCYRFNLLSLLPLNVTAGTEGDHENEEDGDSEFVSTKDREAYQASIKSKPTKQKLLKVSDLFTGACSSLTTCSFTLGKLMRAA
jgi:hypothetical protein